MIKNLVKLIVLLAVCWLVLVLGRFAYLSTLKSDARVYSYGAPNSYVAQEALSGDKMSFSAWGQRNFTKVKYQAPQSTHFTEQTYEKIATLANRTSDFEKDEQKARDIIKEEQAVVQKEESSGLKGARNLEMSIGVLPANFDSMVEKIRKIGVQASFEVSKTDKTNEYAELKAKKAALDDTKKSLMALKNRNGKIDELINLENRIYEINKEMQGLGLQIGEFESDKDFCTVRITLQETGPKTSWIYKFLDAMEWAMMKLLLILVIIFFGMLAAWITLQVVAKAKDLNKLLEAMGKKKK